MKPILFNTEMVQVILNGRKTTTRRVVKPQPTDQFAKPTFIEADGTWREGWARVIKPPYQPGDVLYVRETWYERLGDISMGKYIYRAQAEPQDEIHQYALDQNRWHPSIHMPREAARIFLRVTDVRAERLQEITEGGVNREGHPFSEITGNKLDDFALLWNSTIKKADLDKYGWNVNPWVWVIEFERCEKP